MNDHLDRTVRTVLADIVASTPALDAHPIRLVPVEHEAAGRRPVFAIAAAVLAVVGIGAGLFAMSRQDSSGPAGGSSPRPLLFPPGAQPVGNQVEVPPRRFAAALLSPTGAVYVIAQRENSVGSPEVDAETRTINGHVVARVAAGFYLSYEPCAVTRTQGSASAEAWNDEVSVLLAAQTAAAGPLTIDLPTGWTVLAPAAEEVTGYQYDIEDAIGATAVTIWVVPGGGASLLFDAYGPPDSIGRADFDGHEAWFGTNASRSHLTWLANGNAYDIAAKSATRQQLIDYARSLVPASIEQLRANSERDGAEWGGATFGSTTPTTPGQCGTRTLTLLP